MIRQAHTYLVGALSGVVVIGIAIAAFVVLVSAQVFHDLPIPALSSSDQKAAAVSQGKALNGSPDRQVATTGGAVGPNHAVANADPAAGRPGAKDSQPADNSNGAAPTQNATAPAEVVEAPAGEGLDTDTGSPSSNGGSRSPKPSSNTHTPTPSGNPGSVGGGNPTSTSGSSGTSSGGSGNAAPTGTSGSSGGGAPATGTGGGSPAVPLPATPVTTAKPSEAITETVENTVGTVDEATGGALEETGVPKVAEEVVEGVAGPNSVVGKTVDGVGEAVGGLVGGNGQ